MPVIEQVCREVLEKTEWVAIITSDGDGPHVVATWGEYVRALGIGDDGTLIIPAGHYEKTQVNLERDGRVQLLVASRQVQGNYGPGQGCLISGRAEIATEGDAARLARERYPWARGALVVKVQEVHCQL